MKGPFIFLCSEVTRENAWDIIRWLQDEAVRRYLSDTHDVSDGIAQAMERVKLPVVTHLFRRDGRFYMVHDHQRRPVGFVRLIVHHAETEMVVVIGDQSNWGKRLGTGAIRKSLEIAFFELRSPKVVAKIHRENRRSIRAFIGAGFRLERDTQGIKCFAITLEEYLKFIQGGSVMSGKIYITEIDKVRLQKLIDSALFGETKADKTVLELSREIGRAEVVDPKELPRHVISMNSRAILHMNGKDVEAALVYPQDADWMQNKLSVFSPIGAAILGYGEGDHIEWEVPAGVTRIQIKKILYQPEAAGDYHL